MSQAFMSIGATTPTSRLRREIAPKSHRLWQTQNEDIASSLQSLFTSWFSDVSESEANFKKFVYENSELHQMDLRQHRILLHSLLRDGEELAFLYLNYAYTSNKLEDVKPIIAVIENKLKELFDVLLSWHGDLSIQKDIPESFKTGIQDIKEGKILDFDQQ
jgi:hypothetical protein